MIEAVPDISRASAPPRRLHSSSVLIGIGNDGRQDDGLGWALVDQVEQDGRFPGDIRRCYQLQIEDAELFSHYRQVVLVDACRTGLPAGYQWQLCQPAATFEFTSHALLPETVLALCRRLYGQSPEAHLLLIEGQSWEIELGLSDSARRHLANAWQSLQQLLAASAVE